MDNSNYSLKIHLDFAENSLYDLGYMSIDIYQLIVFCNLLEDNDIYSLEEYYFTPKVKYFALTRYNPIFLKYRNNAKIEHLQDGSMEIVISGVGLIAAIIMPIISIKIQERSKKYSQEVTFEISTNDTQLSNLIDEVGMGYYGDEDEGLKWLLEVLSTKGYSVEVIANDIYRIKKVLDNYENRMTKTIKKFIKY